ncbi:hypothetical protein BL241_04800 [Ralstonia solanacearum]|nr:hypothetical protein [Ralstonia solanacearum]NKA52246.1 hypothetical protein [Ralstonia solanacearum]NKA81863.1 hypothetical protein [Ralstonia solanacearum]NKF53903.1 hypothetical protein [Ralstonia solanacearum]NKF58650.1 hypothetical protein [Ralstonia solanacearum]
MAAQDASLVCSVIVWLSQFLDLVSFDLHLLRSRVCGDCISTFEYPILGFCGAPRHKRESLSLSDQQPKYLTDFLIDNLDGATAPRASRHIEQAITCG